MFKAIIAFISIATGLIATSHADTYNCQFVNSLWTNVGNVYRCEVQSVVSSTTNDTGTNDTFVGTHLAGYINNNVADFTIRFKPLPYFPRGMNRTFVNLRSIAIISTGLKEILSE
ncbi:unnamed protein product [Chironomus riparius]|uniref:Uncharacterized protein n=1 Tax=Chironomus riparius TaxID=315576 RepID=A0A9N9S715_9DIPT|nr:unnamed protein product [Chironomus riparius]